MSKPKPTVHNPSNFEPTDYEVLGYYDNRPPEFFGFGLDPAQMTAAYAAHGRMVAEWREEGRRLFPEGNFHRCQHCGMGNVRYVVAALHKPTGDHVCFGDICEARLDLPGHDAFAAKHVRSAAQLRAKHEANLRMAQRVLDTHPDFAKAYAGYKANPDACRNGFVHDVIRKFEHYYTLSDKQVESATRALARDAEFAARRAAEAATLGDAPRGKAEIEGEIVSFKETDSQWGFVVKVLVKLASGAKVYFTAPAALLNSVQTYEELRTRRIRVRATWEPSRDDKSFGFGSRPSFLGFAG